METSSFSTTRMQIIQSKGNIVEKVFRDRGGRLVRASFYVYESAGRVKARLLKFSYIHELVGQVYSLFAPLLKKISQSLSAFSKSITTPFINKQVLAFSGSKPRAPTFA